MGSPEAGNEGSDSSIVDSSNLVQATDSSKSNKSLNGSTSSRMDATESNNNISSQVGKGLTIIKLLVPKSAGGLLIGKGGQTNKQLSEESGARVKLAPKEESESSATSTEERIVTVIGAYESCQRALAMILQKMEEQPECTISEFDYLLLKISKSTPFYSS